MTDEDDAQRLQSLGRSIVDRSLYMVLATADRVGRPWATPVYFAPEEYRGFVWVSRPDARHSCNIAERPELGIAIFDSSAPISTGRAVYITATGRRLEDDERIAALAAFSHRAVSHGGSPWTVPDLERPEGVRMYRATAVEQHVNDDLDRRQPVTLWP